MTAFIRKTGPAREEGKTVQRCSSSLKRELEYLGVSQIIPEGVAEFSILLVTCASLIVTV